MSGVLYRLGERTTMTGLNQARCGGGLAGGLIGIVICNVLSDMIGPGPGAISVGNYAAFTAGLSVISAIITGILYRRTSSATHNIVIAFLWSANTIAWFFILLMVTFFNPSSWSELSEALSMESWLYLALGLLCGIFVMFYSAEESWKHIRQLCKRPPKSTS